MKIFSILRTFVAFTLISFSAASPSSAAPIGEKNPALAAQVRAIFESHGCMECHAGTDAEANFKAIDFKQIFTGKADSQKALVDLSNPENSLLYLQIKSTPQRTAPMPKGRSNKKLSGEEAQTVLDWIRTEATNLDVSANRPIVSDQNIFQSIFDDVKTSTAAVAKDRRYIVLANLYNRKNPAVGDADLESHRQAIYKLVNSLSWTTNVVKPRIVDSNKVILAINLSDYGWSAQTWERLIRGYPYGVLLDNGISGFVRNQLGTDIPFVRADWFAARASKAPLYDALLGLPSTDKALEDQLGIRVIENITAAQVARAGFPGPAFEGGSGVSDNNRLIERHETKFGSYWKSYDFASSEGEQNLLDRPLGPSPEHSAFVFKHGGGEIIWNLPNGLQAYMITKANGEKIPVAPSEIVRDKLNQGRAVVNGISCIGCHADGMNRNYDQVLDHVKSNAGIFSAITPLVKGIYKNKSTMDTLFNKDNTRFQNALNAAGVTVAKEPINRLAQDFEARVTIEKAAAEVGMTPEDFKSQLSGKSKLDFVKTTLGTTGLTRDRFIALFQDTVKTLEIGASRGFVPEEDNAASQAVAIPSLPSEQKFEIEVYEVLGTEKIVLSISRDYQNSSQFRAEVRGRSSGDEALADVEAAQEQKLRDLMVSQFIGTSATDFTPRSNEIYSMERAYSKADLLNKPKSSVLNLNPNTWPNHLWNFTLDPSPRIYPHRDTGFQAIGSGKNVTLTFYHPVVAKDSNGLPVPTKVSFFTSEFATWAARAKNMGYIICIPEAPSPNLHPGVPVAIEREESGLPSCFGGEWRGLHSHNTQTGQINLVRHQQ